MSGFDDSAGRPTNQFGTPIGPPVPPGAPGYPSQAHVPTAYLPPAFAPPRRGMSTGAKVGIAVGVGLVALVVLSIVAAVAVPVFQSQKARSEAARTTVELPDRIGSFRRVSGSADELVRQQARAVPADWGTPQTWSSSDPAGTVGSRSPTRPLPLCISSPTCLALSSRFRPSISAGPSI